MLKPFVLYSFYDVTVASLRPTPRDITSSRLHREPGDYVEVVLTPFCRRLVRWIALLETSWVELGATNDRDGILPG